MRDKNLETQLRLMRLQLENWKKLHDLITYGLDKSSPIISAEQERRCPRFCRSRRLASLQTRPPPLLGSREQTAKGGAQAITSVGLPKRRDRFCVRIGHGLLGSASDVDGAQYRTILVVEHWDVGFCVAEDVEVMVVGVVQIPVGVSLHVNLLEDREGLCVEHCDWLGGCKAMTGRCVDRAPVGEVVHLDQASSSPSTCTAVRQLSWWPSGAFGTSINCHLFVAGS